MTYHTIVILPGLLFNPSNKQCDWPDNVDCTTSATTSKPSQATSTTTPSVTSTTSKGTTTTTGTKSTTERSSTAVPQPPSAQGPSCAAKKTLEPISEEVKKLRASTCSLENSQVTVKKNHFTSSASRSKLWCQEGQTTRQMCALLSPFSLPSSLNPSSLGLTRPIRKKAGT